MNRKPLRRLAVFLLIPILVSGCSLSRLHQKLFPFWAERDRQESTNEIASAESSSRILPSKPASAKVPSVDPAPPPVVAGSSAESIPAVPMTAPVPVLPDATSSVPKPVSPALPRVRQALPASSRLVYKGDVLTEDTTWRGDVLVDGSLTVSPQATLTVEPGTVVRFRSSGGQGAILVIKGRISAKGTTDLPVTFTSDFTDVQPGDWQGILLLASEKNNLLEHCRIEGAEIGLGANFSRIVLKSSVFSLCRTGAFFQNAFVTVTGGGFRKCTVGIKAGNSELALRDADISGNGAGLTAEASSVSLEHSNLLGNEHEAVLLEGGKFRLYRNTISNNDNGLRLYGAEGGVTANRVIGNGGTGIDTSGSRLRISGNDISGNVGVGFRMEEGNATAWDNVISGNGGYDAYNGGGQLTAVSNWWGTISADAVAGRIGGAGTTTFFPVLQSPPSSKR